MSAPGKSPAPTPSAPASRDLLRPSLALVLLLALPGLVLTLTGTLDFAADDYWHLAAFEAPAYPGGPGPGALFRFWSGVPEQTLAGIQAGSVSWFADPEVKVWFWRPISAATHHLDHTLFGAGALGPKLHSLGWYLLLVALVGRLYRRLLPAHVAGLATLVFAVAAPHWQILTWLAARNASVSAVFALGALLLHLRWRLDGWRPGALLAPLAFGLALLAGEGALGVLAYLLVLELLPGRGSPARRSLALLPCFGVGLGWLATYSARGFGTAASGGYLDPLAEPWTFLAALPGRLLALVGMSYLGFPPDLWFLEPGLRGAAITAGLLSLGLLALLATRASGDGDTLGRRAALALAAASLLAMVPPAAGFLGARNLTLPSVGSSALVGWLLVEAWTRRETWRARPLLAAAAGLLAVVHLVSAPLSWFVSDGLYTRIMVAATRAASLEGLPEGPEARVVTLLAPDVFHARYLPFHRRSLGLPTPSRWHTLSLAPYDHRVTHPEDRTLELEVLDGHMLGTPFESLLRRADKPLAVGAVVDLHDLSAEVLAVDEVGPTRVRFVFERGLDDPDLQLLAWQGGELLPFEPPPLGGEVVLAWVPGPSDFWP